MTKTPIDQARDDVVLKLRVISGVLEMAAKDIDVSKPVDAQWVIELLMRGKSRVEEALNAAPPSAEKVMDAAALQEAIMGGEYDLLHAALVEIRDIVEAEKPSPAKGALLNVISGVVKTAFERIGDAKDRQPLAQSEPARYEANTFMTGYGPCTVEAERDTAGEVSILSDLVTQASDFLDHTVDMGWVDEDCESGGIVLLKDAIKNARIVVTAATKARVKS